MTLRLIFKGYLQPEVSRLVNNSFRIHCPWYKLRTLIPLMYPTGELTALLHVGHNDRPNLDCTCKLAPV